MKRVKKRNLRTEKKTKQIEAFNIKQTFIFRFLIFCVIVLMILVVIYIFVYESKSKEKELGGELGALCIFCSENTVVLNVLNYTLASDNLTINVNINWSAGNISASDFNSILVDFDMRVGANCNYTINSYSGLPNFGENITYLIANFNSGCLEIDFSNVTNVLAYAEVDIHLIQKDLIPDINFYKDDSRNELIYLDNYFYALTEINYNIVENPSNSQIEVVVNNFTKNISISVLDGAWFGAQQFNLTASTEDGDALTTAFSIIVINDTRPILNHEPEFNEDECGEFSWNKNTNKTIDMDSCWSDEDEDSLTYDYSELNNYKENINIIELSGNRLNFAPEIDFNGSTYLNFYANDSHVRVSHRINLHILGNNTIPTTPPVVPTPTPTNILALQSSSPAGSKVSFFVNETKSFSIIAENYENVEWYVDNSLVEEGVLSYTFEETKPGLYIIKARIIQGTSIEDRIWEVTIEEDEYIEENIFGVSAGQVIFYLIIVVLIIVIILIIWLLIIERKRKTRKMNLGFGVSVVPNRNEINESSKQFNIPKD